MLAPTIQYPAAHKGDVVDDHFGTKVADPYRWLEDVDAPDTREWVAAENQVTFSYLEQLPERERIRRRLTELWDYPKYGAPFKKGGRYFFFKNSGLQNQAVLYMQSSLTAEPQVLLDPNTLSADGTVALSTLAFSDDGSLLVYGTSGSGSDWQEFHVRDVASGQGRAGHPKGVQFSRAAGAPGGARLFFPAAPPSPPPVPIPCSPPTTTKKSITTSLAPINQPTGSSMSGPIIPTGASASRGATTPATRSTPCGGAPTGATGSTIKTSAMRGSHASMRRWTGCWTRSTRHTALWATMGRRSFSRPTTRRREAGSSPSIRAIPSPPRGTSSCRRRPTSSKARRSCTARLSCATSTMRPRSSSCSRSTAPPPATCPSRHSAPSRR